MRDTSDMMEDILSEDTMMDCGSNDALYDLIDLSTDISHSAPTIKEAAARLLTLLGVEDDDDDEDDDALSSSEDEGVELDDGSDDDDDDDEDESENSRLLHQLAASLAQELKYSKKQISPITTRLGTIQRGAKSCHEVTRNQQTEDQTHCMEIVQDICHQEDTKLTKLSPNTIDQTFDYKTSSGRSFHGLKNFEYNVSLSPAKFRSETRLRTATHESPTSINVDSGSSGSWIAGWDVCAAEAVRYLVEEEGLSSHHPTVVAMKTHLEHQRERVLAQCGM